ncbi:hypothetical protein RB213_006001 [Colletotrichum asianum]
MSDLHTDNPTILSILSPQPRYAYEWDEEKSKRGQTSVSSKLKKLELPEIEIMDHQDLVKEGRKLLDLITSKEFRYENQTSLDPAKIQRYHPVPGNQSHFPQSEQDRVLIDGRHGRDAIDEIWRVTEKHYPSKKCQFSAEVSVVGVGIFNMTYEEFEKQILSRRPKTDRRGSLASTEDRGRSRSPPTQRASSFHRSRSSPSQPSPPEPEAFLRERERLLDILRPHPRARIPASQQVKQSEALKDLGALYRKFGYEDIKISWIEGRVDMLYSTVVSSTQVGIPPANEMIQQDTSSIGTEKRTGPRSLPLGIPDGLMRPNLAAEAKKYKYITKAVEDIRRVEAKKAQNDGDMMDSRGTRKNIQDVKYTEGTNDLLRQGGGYMIFYRVKYCELFDTRSHIMMHAPGLDMDAHTTTPELWRQSLAKSGPIKLAIFGEEDFDLLPLARLGLRNLAREQTPWDDPV